MKNFFKAFLSVLAFLAAVAGILMLLDDKPSENNYVTIYDDSDEDGNS